MSNIGFITAKKYIKSYDVLKLLQDINASKFDNKLIVFKNESGGDSWHIRYDKVYASSSIGDINFYLHGKRKIGSAHPNNPWWSYVMITFHNELAIMMSGLLSDEGVNETWQPVKDKYDSYINYVHKRCHRLKGHVFKSVVNDYKRMIPKGMEKY